jgi:antitoxin component YwqK of YwqJK toxin-antitoxin module
MNKKAFLFFGLLLLFATSLRAQNLNLDDYDVLLRDTLISKTDFIKNGKSLDSARVRFLTFMPIKDGQRKVYYLNGQLQGQGEIKNKKENGFWTFWHENGLKARRGEFDQGKRTGTHTYWYENGNLRGIGNFKDDKYHGKWTMYKEDGSEKIEQVYKNGELVK